jgi:S1-C subfamily serine protease
MDAYARRLSPESKGVLVALVRPQSAGQNARLEGGDMVMELNGQAVADLEQFTKAYQAFRKERPREAVVLVVLREGRNQTIRIEPPQ